MRTQSYFTHFLTTFKKKILLKVDVTKCVVRERSLHAGWSYCENSPQHYRHFRRPFMHNCFLGILVHNFPVYLSMTRLINLVSIHSRPLLFGEEALSAHCFYLLSTEWQSWQPTGKLSGAVNSLKIRYFPSAVGEENIRAKKRLNIGTETIFMTIFKKIIFSQIWIINY